MTRACPCGAPLKTAGAQAHGVCDYCRYDAKKKAAHRRVPDFAEVLPGFEDWGVNHVTT